MNAETRNCQNCYSEFVIEPEDFNFYKKIDVPPPTWCPDCRLMRRLRMRNDRSLYKGKCDLCGQDGISIFAQGKSWPSYCTDCWKSDRWEGLDYGREYDFSKPFFEQYLELLRVVPRQKLLHRSVVNCEFTNAAAESKNVYLAYSVLSSEDVFYSKNVDKSRSVLDSFDLVKSEQCYENVNCANNYNCFSAINSRNCIDSWFLFDCVNCKHCFMCTNLRNKEYYIKNKPYDREEYTQRLGEMKFGSYYWQKGIKEDFETLQLKSIHKFANLVKCSNSSGDNLENCKNLRSCFNTYDMEDSKFVFRSIASKDCYDVLNGGPNNELFYEYAIGGCPNGSRVKFSMNCLDTVSEVEYSDSCRFSSNLFGCVGLRNKQHCILNKQYTKEEYEELVPKIIEHMNDMPYTDKKGRVYKYGEFFPPELSPFAYNETIAQEYFPLTKEEATEQGYRWKDSEPRNYSITMSYDQIPDHIKDVPDSILNDAIGCAHAYPRESASNPRQSAVQCNHQCTTAFKIIPDELAFYRKMNLPLPRLCPNCRHYARLRQRNPLKLWHRRCMCAGKTSEVKGQMPAPHRREASGAGSDVRYENTVSHFHGDQHCPNEFQTSYSPERPEIVYCKQCYQAEVV